MKLKLILGALFGALAFAAVGYAQTISVPKVSVINPTDLVQIVPNGQPSAQSQYASPAQITSQSGYAKSSPTTGFNLTFGNSQSYLVLTHASTVAQGTVTFASAPSDGAQECIFAQNIVTTLNLVAGASTQTLHNAVSTIGAAARVCYLYSSADGFWDRSN